MEDMERMEAFFVIVQWLDRWIFYHGGMKLLKALPSGSSSGSGILHVLHAHHGRKSSSTASGRENLPILLNLHGEKFSSPTSGREFSMPSMLFMVKNPVARPVDEKYLPTLPTFMVKNPLARPVDEASTPAER